MRLFLFRHCERDSSVPTDPPLSTRGREQAQALPAELRAGRLPVPTRVLVSPKLRTQQSLGPLAEAAGLDLQVWPELDERWRDEAAVAFTARVRRALALLERQTGVVYACSHLDWLEEAWPAIPSTDDLLSDRFQSWAPAQFAEFELQDGGWSLQRVGAV